MILSILLALIAILVLVMAYFAFEIPRSKRAPRFSYLLSALKGEFRFDEEGPLELIRAGYRKCGDIFRLQVLNQSFTVLVGPTASDVFFKATDRELSQKEVYGFTVPVFGRGIVYDADLKIMNQQLKFVKAGVTQDMLASYVAKVCEETELFFERMAEKGTFDIVDGFGELTILTASRCLLGPEIRNELQAEFAEYYHNLNLGMTHLGVFWPNAPTARHKMRDEARANIVRLFSKVIKVRRSIPDASDRFNDYLQMLIDSQYVDGSRPSDDEICGLLLATLFAGQHTSSITSVWLILSILKCKDKLFSRIMEEQKVALTRTNGKLNFEALDQMELLHNSVKETLRLFPPLVVLMRYVQKTRTYKNYEVPPGEIVLCSPAINHMLPESFKDPESFDPDRFAEPRKEDEMTKYSLIPFGSGRHHCLGDKFAFVQLKSIASVLFRKYNIEMLGEFPKKDYSALVVGPKGKCLMRITKKSTAEAALNSGLSSTIVA